MPSQYPSNTSAARRELLPVPQSARVVEREIVTELRRMLGSSCRSCLESDFTASLDRVWSLFAAFQDNVLAASGVKTSCRPGCHHCCWHWVEDVNSFEGEIAADYIRRHSPQRIPEIVRLCEEDTLLLERLDDIVTSKLADVEEKRIDAVDLLLSSFYQMQRPCPMLDSDGTCGVYPVRPMTCRIYLSFSDRSRCHPDYINEGDIPTYLLDIDEEANDLFDKLHFRFRRFDGDTGLRSLVAKYLKH